MTTTFGPVAPITEQKAHAIGVDAYLSFYPLLTMDATRKHPPVTKAGTPASPLAQ